MKELLEKLIKKSLDDLYQNDQDLLKRKVAERDLTGLFAHYFRNNMKDTAIADYHRRFVNEKQKFVADNKSKYITYQEAAEIAGVAKSAVAKWISKDLVRVEYVGKTKKILREEFETFLAMRSQGEEV